MAGYTLTKEEIRQEIFRCAKDPLYFINNYCQISHPTKGTMPFKMFKYQKECLKDFVDHRFNIILKARQLGMSTLIAAYCAWMCNFHREKEIMILATKLSTATNLVKKTKYMLRRIPDWLKICKFEVDNRTSFQMDNGSQMKASASSEDAGRSDALSLLVLDEAAHIDKIEEIWTSVYSTLSTGGNCIACSCVTKDTYVVTDRGIKQIGDFIQEGRKGGYYIENYNILGKNKLRRGNLFCNNGFTKTRKIYSTNAILEGSLSHKLWACKDGKYGWYRLEELNIGDYVSIQYGDDIWGNNDDVSDFNPILSNNHKVIFTPKKITKEIAYIIGLYLSEGSVYQVKNKKNQLVGGTTTFACGDDLTEKLELGGLSVSKSDNMHHCCSSKTFIEFMQYLGFNLSLHAPKKYIPKRLLEMSRENIIYLLRGLFDGDGCSRIDRGEVCIQLSTKKMIEQIRIILLNLGILTEYCEGITPPTQRVRVSSKFYRLSLNKKESEKYYNLVGFDFERKQYKRIALEKSNLNRSDTKDVVPFSLQHMKNMFEMCKFGTWTFEKKYGLCIGGVVNKTKEYKTQHISRQNVIKMFEIAQNEGVLPEWYKEELETFVSKNLKWNRIDKIEEGESETYDFSLPDLSGDKWDHSVVYNGVLGHQSPAGVGNWFHQTYTEAEEGKNDFNSIKLFWDVHPERDQAWFDSETKNMTTRQIAQELLCSFEMSGENVFDAKDLEFLDECGLQPKYRTAFDRNLWIWKKYDPERAYLLSADVSRGDGKDYSVIVLVDITTMEVVAEYQGKPTPDVFASLIEEVGKQYGGCMVVVENNSVGFTVLTKLIDSNYPNLYYSIKATSEYIEQYQAEQKSGTVPGFTTSQRTRPLIIAKLEEYVRNRLITIRSKRMTNEMRTFIWNNGRPEAMRKYNDDLIMACAIACWVRDTALVTNQRDLDYTKSFLSSMIRTSKKLDNEISNVDVFKPYGDSKKVPSEALKQMRAFSWVYKG